MTSPTLGQAFTALQAALEPLAIEVGDEVLNVWRDRVAHGADPIPAGALRRLAAVAGGLLDEQRAAPVGPPR